MTIIYRGAEAIIEKIDENTLLKKRVEKGYRIRCLDMKIRRMRTKREIKILKDVKRLGINVPTITREGEFEFEMEFIKGKRIKDVITDELSAKTFGDEIGKIVGILHFNNIVHNDLTLSNILFFNNKIYLIDFGLANYDESIEKKAEDILTLYYSVKSLIPDFFEIFFKSFEENYKDTYHMGNKVIDRVKKILKRVRYVLRNGN